MFTFVAYRTYDPNQEAIKDRFGDKSKSGVADTQTVGPSCSLTQDSDLQNSLS